MPLSTDPDGVLFERLRPRLTAISRRIVGSTAEAEDVVQDCFIKWQDADHAALLTPVAWLTTVVQHQSVDLVRRRNREVLASHAVMELLPEAAPALPEDALLRRAELGEALAHMLARLSAAERLALVLHEVFDCKHADIAAILGTKSANARQNLARARRRLGQGTQEAPADEKLSRELIRRFQNAINGVDVPAMVVLLGDEQPVSVHDAAPVAGSGKPCANDASYRMSLAA